MQSAIDFTAHSMPLNSLEHCIGTTSMTNIRPDEDLNPVEFRAIAGSNVPSKVETASLFQTQTNLFGFLLMLHQIYINMINRVWDLP